jgi:hypothetical protein
MDGRWELSRYALRNLNKTNTPRGFVVFKVLDTTSKSSGLLDKYSWLVHQLPGFDAKLHTRRYATKLLGITASANLSWVL